MTGLGKQLVAGLLLFSTVSLFCSASPKPEVYSLSEYSSLSLELTESDNSCNIPSELVREAVVIPASKSCDSFDVLRCYCLTFEVCTLQLCSTEPRFAVGKCLYGCFKTDHASEYHNTSAFSKTCSPFKRKGTLCRECIQGYGVPAYSFSLTCVSCGNETLWYTVPRYILVAYGPLTLFLVMIVVLTISVNSAPLRGWILVCQILSGNFVMYALTLNSEFHPNTHLFPYVQIFHSVYGIWNLDFFRSVYKPFCIHPSLTTLQVMSLDYIIAAYPLVLIVVMYAMVELYSNNCRAMVLVGRLFHRCCVRFRHQLNIRTSLVDAFGTFFSLSFVKFLSTTANLLSSTEVWYSDNNEKSWRVYFDESKEPFRGSHIPYAVVAVLFTLLFNILPLVLILLYSFPKCQTLLIVIPGSVQRAIYPFIDNILGCYNDGTNELSLLCSSLFCTGWFSKRTVMD